MHAVIQRVISATVKVNNQKISSISQGYFIISASRRLKFLYLLEDDTIGDVENLTETILKLRLFNDIKDGKNGAKILKTLGEKFYAAMSQFTLQAKLKKFKPDFHMAAKTEEAKELYIRILEKLRQGLGDDKIKDGIFGAMMEVQLINDGPVTINYDTKS
ncbi:hypothetical protein PMAC_002159 [Pneumocystis sp. 'macacae']|nr:hypothetical protein PMAC_002159 [Pneumocystis sp. 'macacae']